MSQRRPFPYAPSTRTQLQRTTTLPAYQQPNEYDLCTAEEALIWDSIIPGRGLYNLCCPRGRKPYVNKPWISMPAEGRRFKPIGILDAPDLTNPANLNVPFTVLSEYCPLGYNGVITDVVLTWSGTGFVEGSGDLVWRVSADNRYLRDYGNVQTSLGSLTYPSPVPRGGLVIMSRNLVKVDVEFGTNSGASLSASGKVIVSITGWWWAR